MPEENKRLGFSFLKSYYEVFKRLPDDKSKVDFITAICEKQLEGNELDLEGIVEFAYASQKHNIDKSRKGWEDVQKRTKIVTPSVDPSQGASIHPSVGPSEQEKEKVEEEVKGEVKEKEKEINYNYSDVVSYFTEKAEELNLDKDKLLKKVEWAYQYYEENGFKNSKGRVVKNIKTTIKNNWIKDWDDFKKVSSIVEKARKIAL